MLSSLSLVSVSLSNKKDFDGIVFLWENGERGFGTEMKNGALESGERGTSLCEFRDLLLHCDDERRERRGKKKVKESRVENKIRPGDDI